MSGFTAFFKKEIVEYLRSYKALILLCVFIIFGMMSPLLAKMMPDILSHQAINGITLNIPKPTFYDSFGQFFKNLSQMGMAVLLLIFGGVLSQDLSKGTLIMLLAKGLSRHAVILAKFAAALILWTASYAFAVMIQWGYTLYLFDKLPVPHLFFSLFCLWLFGIFILTILLMSSTLVGGAYSGLFLTTAALGALIVCQFIPGTDRFSPLALASDNAGLMTGAANLHHAVTAVWITVILIVSALAVSLVVFKKKSI
ncbi:ABC transporter permease [Sporolactobacillus shoreae]|uniref:ABC transporter permease n=1 Tax=Sporolactobacillus shoreae TaxID=1465501 RepID=A0A4Z0GR10_9BACL|nr:ABC transporter permease subunit [Sporolactobacillus shoreae]TGA98876.1 ABC transporter permease [Sporolactobacillus shoreae]